MLEAKSKDKKPSPFVRTENVFPKHDAMWLGAKFVIEELERPEKILAPFEFSEFFPSIDPVQFSYFVDVEHYDVVVVNKAQIDRYSDEFLRKVQQNMHYLFGNSVFNVYTKEAGTISGAIKHRYEPSEITQKLKASLRSSKKSSTLFSWGRRKEKTVLIVSASKFGNAGDDAITEAAEKIIKKAIKNANVILARPPFSRYDVDKADYVVLGGGGVLYDSCFNNAMNYCDYLLYAQSQGKPTFGIGLGTQGIKSLRGRQLYQEALSKCEFLVVRNGRDQEVLEQDCSVSCPVYTTNDIVFSFGKTDHVMPAPKYRAENTKRVAISLLDSKHLLAARAMKKYREGCEDSIRYLCERYSVVFVVQSKDDIDLYRPYVDEFSADIVSFDYGNTRKFIEFYRTVNLSITSRFHGYIFSLLAGVPVISVGSNAGKIDRLIKSSISSGAAGYVPLRDFSIETFKKVHQLFERDPKLLIPEPSEVKNSVVLAESTVDIIKKFIR